jgi:ADP-ribose pyrophosphatase
LIETKISGEVVFSGRVFSVERDTADCGGLSVTREVVRHPGGVAVLAVTDDDRVVMVRQYRYGAGTELLEIPAGRLEPGEDPMAAGKRELAEETGFTAAEFAAFGRFIPTGAYNSEVIWIYLATGLTAGDPDPDEGEFVSIKLFPFDKALEMVLDGTVEDGKTAYALMKYKLLRRDAP